MKIHNSKDETRLTITMDNYNDWPVEKRILDIDLARNTVEIDIKAVIFLVRKYKKKEKETDEKLKWLCKNICPKRDFCKDPNNRPPCKGL